MKGELSTKSFLCRARSKIHRYVAASACSNDNKIEVLFLLSIINTVRFWGWGEEGKGEYGKVQSLSMLHTSYSYPIYNQFLPSMFSC